MLCWEVMKKSIVTDFWLSCSPNFSKIGFLGFNVKFFFFYSYLTMELDSFLWIDVQMIALPPLASNTSIKVLERVSKQCAVFFNYSGWLCIKSSALDCKYWIIDINLGESWWELWKRSSKDKGQTGSSSSIPLSIIISLSSP